MANTDTYEQNLGQKSSLTTSDFIRVVGSDNVSYKQGVPSVLASMGLSLYYTDTNSTSDGSTEDARYTASFKRVLTTFSNANPTVNRTYPIMIVTSGSSGGTFAGVVNVTSTAMRFFLSYANLNYSGQFLRSNNTINTIQRMPSRIEIDALNSKTVLTQSISVSPNGSATVTLPSVAGSFLCAWRGQNAVWRGLALITKASTSDGVATVITSNMGTVTESGNTLTFTNLHSTASQTYYIEINRIGD